MHLIVWTACAWAVMRSDAHRPCAGRRARAAAAIRPALLVGLVVCSGRSLARAADEAPTVQAPRTMGYPFGNNLTRPEPVRIAVTMPITSRGDVAAGVAGMRVFNSFLPSFLATAFPTAFPCAFDFWLAYDMGDALLDSPQVRVPPPTHARRLPAPVTCIFCIFIPTMNQQHHRPRVLCVILDYYTLKLLSC